MIEFAFNKEVLEQKVAQTRWIDLKLPKILQVMNCSSTNLSNMELCQAQVVIAASKWTSEGLCPIVRPSLVLSKKVQTQFTSTGELPTQPPRNQTNPT